MIYPRCVFDYNSDSAEHNRSFIPYSLYNMFRPYGPSSGWQKWKINK